MLDRRVFLQRSGAVAAGLSLLPGDLRALSIQAGTYFRWDSPREGVHIGRGGGGASLVVASGGESLLVDCKGYGLGDTLRREVEAFGGRLTAVVNTHHHAAQTGGNVAFTPDVPVIGHRRAGPWIVDAIEGVLEALQAERDPIIERRRAQIEEMANTPEGARAAVAEFDAHVATIDNLGPGNFGPTQVFDSSLSLRVGDLDVELRHFGRAHTDNDVVVWIPALDLAHVGNLLYIDAHPLIDAARGADTRSWQSVLGRVHDLVGPEALLIPSEGDLDASAHDIDAQVAYFDQIRDLAQGAVDAGMSREETVQFIPTTRMGRFTRLAEPERLPVNLGIVYDEIVLL